MSIGFSRLRWLTVLAPIALGMALVGCAWGVITDAQTGEPIVGAEVKFQDSNGNTGTISSGAGGLYAFDAAKGQPIPAAGPTTYTIAAPGHDTLTQQRNVAYDDSGAAIWEVQSFVISQTGAPPPVQGLQLAIDADPSIPDIQTSRTVAAGGPFPVDIVLVNPPAPLAVFSFELLYDDTIILAPEVADEPTASLDDNPDANQAALGEGWDCSILDINFPTGDGNLATGPDAGDASLNCWNLLGPYTFASTGVIASVMFAPVGHGTTTLSLANVVLGDNQATEIGNCNLTNPTLTGEMTCGSATITVP
jgi:hypothetical protein